ncbi:transposase [Amycolatopsis sp. NPDC059090]|uniref:transposase n=1 Tax=Amycolatopsis sp. NPDC059090 TaxID=3346723 RepID=UPI00366C770A
MIDYSADLPITGHQPSRTLSQSQIHLTGDIRPCGVTHHSYAWVLTTAGARRNHCRRGKGHCVTMLTESIEGVIGVDTHRDTLLIEPRQRGDREALRVLMSTRAGAVTVRTAAINHLKALIVSAPEELRAELRDRTSDSQIDYCAKLRDRPAQNLEHRTTARAMRSTARRIHALKAEANELERGIARLVGQTRPDLARLPGVGPISAAQVLISWSHPCRFRSEAAFASLAGTAPIPASSGPTNRYRLNRGGDRQLNRALHTTVLTRSRTDPATRAYIDRRLAKGKTSATSNAA